MIQWTGVIRRRPARNFWRDALAVAFAITSVGGCVHVPQTTALDPRLPRVVVDGYPFHVRTFGREGTPPVIVLHGGPGGDMQYLQSLSALGSDYHVLFYDQRGTGLSARDDAARHSIDLFLSDLDGIVRAHAGSRRVRLVGHSWGAMLAVAYTARHGDRVSHLVASEPGILSPNSAAEFFPKVKATQSLSTKGTQHVKVTQTGHNLFTTASAPRAVAAVADFLR